MKSKLQRRVCNDDSYCNGFQPGAQVADGSKDAHIQPHKSNFCCEMLAHSTCAESFGSLNDFKSILVILSHDGGSNPLMSCKWIQLIDTLTTTTEKGTFITADSKTPITARSLMATQINLLKLLILFIW